MYGKEPRGGADEIRKAYKDWAANPLLGHDVVYRISFRGTPLDGMSGLRVYNPEKWGTFTVLNKDRGAEVYEKSKNV